MPSPPTSDQQTPPPPAGTESLLPPRPEPDKGGTVREVIITVVVAVVLALGTQQFLVKPFRIPSPSMERTLLCGDRVLVDRISWRFSDPERGDVVVFRPPAFIKDNGKADPSDVLSINDQLQKNTSPDPKTLVKADTNYIKRIVGMPGETVEEREGVIYINGKKLDEPYLHPVKSTNDFGPFKVPKGTYMMMGDNRTQSSDSRVMFGPVPRDFMIGPAFAVYWPPKRMGTIPEQDPGIKKGEPIPSANCTGFEDVTTPPEVEGAE